MEGYLIMANWENGKFTCECGCGGEVKPLSDYVRGHFPRSPEQKRSASEMQQEYWQDPENRRKQAEKMTGITHTPETRRANSLRQQEYYQDPENRRKQSERSIGIIHTPEQNRAKSLRMQEYYQDPENRRKTSEAMTGITHTPEAKKAISLGIQEYYQDPENRRKASERMSGRTYTPEQNRNNSLAQQKRYQDPEERRKISVAMTGKTHTPETKQKMRESLRKRWADPENKKRQLEAMAAGRNSKPNKVELMLWGDIQQALPSGWEMNVTEGRSIAGLFPDFINEKEKGIIEMFGTHWHDEFTFPGRTTEAQTIARYKEVGYDCIVVWEDDVKDGTHMVELERFAVGRS